MEYETFISPVLKEIQFVFPPSRMHDGLRFCATASTDFMESYCREIINQIISILIKKSNRVVFMGMGTHDNLPVLLKAMILTAAGDFAIIGKHTVQLWDQSGLSNS